MRVKPVTAGALLFSSKRSHIPAEDSGSYDTKGGDFSPRFSPISRHSKVYSVQCAKTFINLDNLAVVTNWPKTANGIHIIEVYFSFLARVQEGFRWVREFCFTHSFCVRIWLLIFWGCQDPTAERAPYERILWPGSEAVHFKGVTSHTKFYWLEFSQVVTTAKEAGKCSLAVCSSRRVGLGCTVSPQSRA